jgi:methionine synthase II (cobalamin-independent)
LLHKGPSGQYLLIPGVTTMITGIGSFPYTDIDKALDLIFTTCGKIPFWPQLPKRSFYENMYTTFLEGVPCIKIDESKGAVFMDTTETEGIEEFYENFGGDNLDAFALTEKTAPGFLGFLKRLGETGNGADYVKAQLTGPFSMGLGLPDENGKPIIYNDAYFDIIKKALQMKARWIIDAINRQAPGKEIILFFDEPYMVSFGSAYVSISKDDAIALFDEVTSGLNARRGVHCCGNTDWSVLFNTTIDIVNYDAFNYIDTITYFSEELSRFLNRGGWIAPGIVPSSEKVMEITLDDLVKMWNEFVSRLEGMGIDPKAQKWLFTTSCGLGSLGVKEAETAMQLLKDFSESPEVKQ